MTAEGADRARARRLISLQALGGALAGVAVAGLVVLGVVLVGQRRDLDSQLRELVATTPTEGLPAGTWVVKVDASGSRTATTGAPEEALEEQSQVEAARRLPKARVTELQAGSREYQTMTAVRRGVVVQAGVELGPYEGERHRLLVGLLLAAVGAGAVALWLGTRLARRAVGIWEQALTRQRRFVADASHELRTPLARIALRADLVQRRLATDRARSADVEQEEWSRLASDVALLRREATGLADVVEDLLAAADLDESPESGELVDLAALARDVASRNEVLAEQRQRTLGLDVGEVPPVRGAEPALRRAVDALVDNALRHAESRVVLGVRTAESWAGGTAGGAPVVVVTVDDDGPGFTAGDSERVFERFVRGTSSSEHGFGIGLSLVRDVVLRHQGTVTAKAAPGGGGRVEVRLPVAQA
ncbi:HAMP domain-containing sensor histidine kinase [Phycicoccus sp. M110.8]|uniref:sensor histidine kinase n=1 Tax=Phycicoccus sp. M110.8 TaxID=3075433 RepID=UPI0028FD81ED|nr:HAMP domain-containing sensor histidine kinase [Phycicoccus sp. M110.8]MDU0312572.1 HAMP domain-containing sensor histidine kinase [Phycicoccus sp. M110.8]